MLYIDLPNAWEHSSSRVDVFIYIGPPAPIGAKLCNFFSLCNFSCEG